MKRKALVLMVEDDRLDQIAFERFVREHDCDFEYRLAGSLEEARSLLRAEKFDAILTDYHLPDGTGLDLLPAAGRIPTAVLTGAGNESIAVSAMRAGALDYLIKDMLRNYLKLIPSVVADIVHRRKMEDEREQLIVDLKKALDEVQTLTGMLPICASCKKVRDDKGYWHQIESYISKHSAAVFSHGYCPACAKKAMDDAERL